MEVVVKRSALFNLLKNRLNEDGQARSEMFLQPKNMEDFGEEDSPIEASPQMALQLSEEEPPVSDPEYVPGSIRELELASMVIMKEVPGSQIEFVYRFLHKLLDMALDREEEAQGQGTSNIVTESRDYYMKRAADRVRQGEDATDIAQDMIDMYDEFEGMDSFELGQQIEDMTYSSMGFDMSEPEPEPAAAAIQKPTPVVKRRPKRMVVRSGGRAEELKPTSAIVQSDLDFDEDDLESLEKIDITNMSDEDAVKATAVQIARGLSMLALAIEPLETLAVSIDSNNDLSLDQKAAAKAKIPHRKLGIDNYKTLFMFNYDSSSRKHADMFRDSANSGKFESEIARQIKIAMDHGPSFLSAPTPQYREYEYEEDDTLPDVSDSASTPEDLPFSARRLYDASTNKQQFINGFNAGADHAAAEDGSTPDLSSEHPDYVSGFGFGYEDIAGEKLPVNEAIRKVRKRYETPESEAQRSLYRDKLREFKAFNANIAALQKKLGTSLDETIKKISVEVVKIMQEKIANLEYGDEKEKTNQALSNTFARLVSYFDQSKGVGQKHLETTKPYQANNSMNFYKNVKEEYREDIIHDFLELLAKKYLKGDVYKIASGRKDPNDPSGRRKEYYTKPADEFRKLAEEYANEQIDAGLEKQKAVSSSLEDTEDNFGSDGDPEVELDLAYSLATKENATQEEEEKVISGFWKKYAAEFGFSGASGMRQWFIKKPNRLFMMMVESFKGNRVLAEIHNKTLLTVLKIVADQLPDIIHSKVINGKMVVDYDNHDPEKEMENYAGSDIDDIQNLPAGYEEVFERFVMKESLKEIQQAMQALKSNRGMLLSDIKVNSGGKEVSFVSTPGGKIVINLNALIYDKFLVKFDKDYTDFVSDKLLNDKTVQREMENVLGTEPKITPKIAKSLAEYFTGKKEKPVLVIVKERDEEDGEIYERHEFKKNEKGEYPNKGGAAKLLEQGIDGETFNYLFNKVSDHLKNTALQSFKPTYAFEKEKKADILTNYKTTVVDKMLENFEDKGVRDQIHNAVKELVSFYR